MAKVKILLVGGEFGGQTREVKAGATEVLELPSMMPGKPDGGWHVYRRIGRMSKDGLPIFRIMECPAVRRIRCELELELRQRLFARGAIKTMRDPAEVAALYKDQPPRTLLRLKPDTMPLSEQIIKDRR